MMVIIRPIGRRPRGPRAASRKVSKVCQTTGTSRAPNPTRPLTNSSPYHVWWLPMGMYSTACDPGCTVPCPNQTASARQRSVAMRCNVSRTRVLSARAPLNADTASLAAAASAAPQMASDAVRPDNTRQAQLRRINGIMRGATVQAASPTRPMRDFDAKIIRRPAAMPMRRQRRSLSSSANRTWTTPRSAAKGDQGA